MTLVWLPLSAFGSLLIVATVFRRWSLPRKAFLGLLIWAGLFAAMLLNERYLGNSDAWNVYAFVFIGLIAWFSEEVWMRTWFGREREVWEGHAHQDPETEHFSETIKLTVNNLTGACHGLVLEGPYRGRRLSDLSVAEIGDLANQLADDPQGKALLDRFATAPA